MGEPAEQMVGADAHEDVADSLTKGLSRSVSEAA